MDATQFLSAIFGKLNESEGICIRALQHGGGKVEQKFYDTTDAIPQDPDIQKWNASLSIYFGTALRDLTSADKAKKPGCIALTALWADLDAKDFTTPHDPKAMSSEERKAGKRLIGLCLKDKLPEALLPSILVDTGGGYQAYWLLKEPIRIGPDDDQGYTVETIEGYLSGLQQHIGADPARKDVTSIMRLPGTVNCKYPERPICRVIRFAPERRFNLSDFDEYRVEPTRQAPGTPDPTAGQDFPALLEAFKAQQMYLKPQGEKHLVVCPWKDTHTTLSGPTETVLYEPSNENGYAGGFKCQHGHCADKTIADVYQLFVPQPARPTVGGTAPAPESQTLMSVAEMQQRLGKHTDWLVDRMLAVGDLSVLVSKPGVGKSTFAAQLAVSVAYGKSFLDRATTQGLVVVLAFEGARSTMAQMVRLGHAPANRNILMWSAETDGKDPAAWLATILKDVSPALIIVDTLADFARTRHGASNAGYEEMIAKLGGVYGWAQARRAHVQLLHHGAKGDRDGIDSALGTIGIVGKPGTVLDYRPMNSKDENSPRVLKGLKHREGDKERDLPALVLDFDRDRGLTVAGFREEVSVRELGVAIIRIVVQTPDVKQVEVLAEVEGRKASKLEALRLLVDPTTGVLVRIGTPGPGNRAFPLRLSVRADLDGDPVEVWRRSHRNRFPAVE